MSLLGTLVIAAKLLNDIPFDRANRLFLHPIHRDSYVTEGQIGPVQVITLSYGHDSSAHLQ